jgi:uncharacterized protein YPO0396
MNDDYISTEAKELAGKAKTLSKKQIAEAIQNLINTTAEQTAGNIFRGTNDEIERLTERIADAEAAIEKLDYTDAYFGKYPDKIKGNKKGELGSPLSRGVDSD